MRRWRVLTLRATEVYVHPAVVLYALYAGLTGHLMFMLLAMASIVLHEAAHALTAACFGKSPRCIEITPLGAVMRLEDEARLPHLKRAVMLLAGPAMTLLLCQLGLWAAQRGWLPLTLARTLFLCNLSILLLNLLPVLPLDGGRLLALLMELFLRRNLAGKVMRVVSTTVGTGLILLNIFTAWRYGGWNLSLAFAGCCILYSAAISASTQAMAELRYFMDRKITLEQRRCIETTWYTSVHTNTLRTLVRHLPPRRIAMFICLGEGSCKYLGCLTESELIQRYLQEPNMILAEAVKTQQKRPEFDKSSTI